jgi:hypothetical protein
MTSGREFKGPAVRQIGRIARALDSPRRLEMLAQGERCVEDLAAQAGRRPAGRRAAGRHERPLRVAAGAPQPGHPLAVRRRQHMVRLTAEEGAD